MAADPRFRDHIVLFLDFLGTSEAVDNVERSSKLLTLLVDAAKLRREFAGKVEAGDHGSKTLSFKPTISTFSDHIVMSAPLAELLRDEDFAEMAITHLRELAAIVAWHALRIGFLMRGGMTVGLLYHAHDVVFGKAMVDAYEIEAWTSVYPRIVVSRNVQTLPGAASVIRRDDDGLHHLDYFGWMVFLIAISDRPREVYEEAIRVIEEQLVRLTQAEKLNELAKWSWFRRRWEAALASLDPHLRSNLGLRR